MTLVIPDNFSQPVSHSPKMRYFWFVTLFVIAFSGLLKVPTFNFQHNEGDEIRFLFLTKNWLDTGRYTLRGSPLLNEPVYKYQADRALPVHPPLFPALLAPFIKYNAINKAVIASWLGHFLAILAVALIGRYLFLFYGLTASAFSPLFWIPLLGIATDPIMTWVSGVLWIDNLHAGLGVLALALALIASQSTRHRLIYFFAGIILGLALLSKVTALIMVPLIVLAILICETDKQRRWQALLFGAIPALVLSLPWYLSLYFVMGEFIFPQLPPHIREMKQTLPPEEWQKIESLIHCQFCEVAGNRPWYYLLVKLPLVEPIVLLGISFSVFFFLSYAKIVEGFKKLHFLFPLFWSLFFILVGLVIHITIMRRMTAFVPSLYLMLFMLLIYSEKFAALKKYQNLLLLLGGMSILYAAIGGGYFLFKGGYAEIFSMLELAGFINLWQ